MRRTDALAMAGIAFALGATTGVVLERAWGDDRPIKPPPVEVETEALLDATTIEMRGYGPDGQPGEFLYDCKHDGTRLVCTQREGVQ